jgi:hypothetical protein
MKRLLIVLACALSACGGDSFNSMDDYELPEPNLSPGGVWAGTRANGTEIVVLVTETGEFRMLDPFGNVGFGQVTVSNIDEISVTYNIAPPFQGTIFDGSTGASCTAEGLFEERVSMDFETACTSTTGTSFGGPVSLALSDISPRMSSLAVISGSYDDGGDVLTIDSAGEIFEQSTTTGCVINGEVGIVEPNWNLYAATLTTDNCEDEFTSLNGRTWEGVVTLVDDQGVDIVFGGFHTDVDGTDVGLLIALPRL